MALLTRASDQPLQPARTMQGYTATKAGLCGLTRAQAVSLGTPERRIRVNSILPGWIDNTGGQLGDTQEDRDWHLVGACAVLRALSCLLLLIDADDCAGRLGQLEDVAGAALFLADPKCSGFITGQQLIVDGGVPLKLVYRE